MKKRHWCSCLILLGALSIFGTPAFADTPSPRSGFSLGGRAAYYKNNAPGSRETWFGGAQARWHWTPSIAWEGSIDYRRERFAMDSYADVYPVQASLLGYLARKSPVSPFILGGFGWYYTHVKGPFGFDRTQNRFGPHAGAGVEFFLNEHWSFDGTWRYLWLNDVRGRQNLVDTNFDGRGWMATGGLNYRF